MFYWTYDLLKPFPLWTCKGGRIVQAVKSNEKWFVGPPIGTISPDFDFVSIHVVFDLLENLIFGLFHQIKKKHVYFVSSFHQTVFVIKMFQLICKCAWIKEQKCKECKAGEICSIVNNDCTHFDNFHIICIGMYVTVTKSVCFNVLRSVGDNAFHA